MNITAVWDMLMRPVAGRYGPAAFIFKPNYKASKSRKSGYMAEGKKFRRIYRPVVQQGLWGIKTNQQFKKLHKYLDNGAYIKNKTMEWIGHLVKWIREGHL